MPTLVAAIDARKAKQGSDMFTQSVDRMGRKATEADRKLTRVNRRLDRTGVAATRAKSSMMGMFGGITAGIALLATVKAMASFEQTMATVGAVTRATDEDFGRLTATAKEMGALTRFSATQAGEGLLFLARAGFDTNEAIAALPSTLSLASAGALELGEAADFASNILSQFNLATDETNRVVDTLIITSNRSNTNVRQLAEAMKFAGPVSGALGISIEETASAIGVLGDSGIQASLAGTNMRGMLSGLLGPTSKANKALKAMGLSMEDVSPEKHDLLNIYRKFEDANITASQAVAIFGRRNAGAALILASNTDKMNELILANKEFVGEADRVAKAMDATLAGSFRALKSSIEGAMIATGDAGFLRVLQSTVDTVTGAVRILIGMEDAVTKNVLASKILANVIKVIGVGLGVVIALKFVRFLKNATMATWGFVSAQFALNTVLTKTIALVGILLSAFAAFELGKFLFDEFKVVQTTMTELVFGVQMQWEEFKKWWKELWVDLSELAVEQMSALAETLAGLIPGEASTIRGIGTTMLGSPQTMGIGLMLQSVAAAKEGTLGMNAGQTKKDMEAEREKIQAEYDTQMQLLSEALVATLDEIEKEFAGKTRKGGTFTGMVAEDLGVYHTQVSSFIDSLNEIEGAVKKAAEGVEGMGDAAEEAADGTKKAKDETIQLTEAMLSADEAFDKMFENLQRERTLVGLSSSARQERLLILEAEKLAKAAGELVSEEDLRLMKEEIAAIQALKQNQEDIKELDSAFQSMGDSAAKAFSDVILNSKSAGDALGELFDQLQRIAFQQMVTAPLGDFFAGLSGSVAGAVAGAPATPTAFGGVFDNGQVVPFSSGGVFDRPSYFPLAGGKVGMMGESGPETVVPLRREADGKLGFGGNTYNITMNIQTPDANSFRRSERQQVARMKRIANGFS